MGGGLNSEMMQQSMEMMRNNPELMRQMMSAVNPQLAQNPQMERVSFYYFVYSISKVLNLSARITKNPRFRC